MNSHSAETLGDPLFQRRMPLFNENMASSGLSKPRNMSSFMGKQTLQYRGAFYSYEPREKDGAAFSPPWSSSKTPAVDGRSPVRHLSGMDGLSHIIYRQDTTSQESPSPFSSQRLSIEKQGFAFYTKSPGISSPQPTAATSVIVRKPKDEGQSVSPLPEKPVYLAIPRPIYGHNPCCSEMCCVMGQRYSMGHGSPTVSNSGYKQTWRHREPSHTETLSSQQKAQQKRLQMEAIVELPQSVAMYSPGRARTLPAVVDQSYSPTKLKEWFDSSNEQGQCLQPSPRAYPSLYPSHNTYEPVIYQHRCPISKYGHIAQHPMFYYPPTNVQAEKSTECKDMGSKHTEDVPIILKHSIQTPGDRYGVAPSLCADISLPRTEALPNPSFSQGYAYPGYTVPRLHLNTSPTHAPLKHPHTVHSKYMNTSPSNQVHHPVASPANMHKDESHLHTEHSSPFVLLEQTSPSTCIPKSAVAPSSGHTQNRYCPLRGCVHLDRPLMAPAHVRSYVKQPHISPPAWGSPKHSAVSNKSNVQKLLYCPPLDAETKTSPNPRPNVPKGPVKRSISHLSSPIKINDDDDDDEDMYVVDTCQKRQKTEKGHSEIQIKNVSPPMPVIDNVFSLAPYQTYLQNPRLFWGRMPQKPLQCVEFSKAKRSAEAIKQEFPKRFQQQSAIVSEAILLGPPTAEEECPEECKQPSAGASEDRSDIPKAQVNVKQEGPEEVQRMSDVVSKNTKVDSSTVKAAVEKNEPHVIKKETVDCGDCAEMSVCQDQLKIIKREPEESDLTDCEPMLEIKKRELDELENSVSVDKTEPAQKNCSSGTEAHSLNELLLKPPSKATPEHKLHFLNIPPQCLKLSTYNIILPDANLPHTVQIAAKTPVQSVSQAALPSLELKMPARKHFFELHQSLVALISTSVAASSEETLTSWLSRMELNNLASLAAKVQKVTCLFGVKGREACLSEEMKSSMHSVLQRLNEYTAQERCPFPFVIRTGAIFLPMLVLKEVLFPTVQGSLIDQVLQEHKVELRPATLSEEKTLIQLHKRACSSRLRRLMSLKHLPDVYADVVNLLFYTCVCKHLGLEMDSVDPDEASEGSNSCRSPAMPPQSPHSGSQQEPQTKSTLKRKSRIKSSSRRTFLKCLSDEEEDTLKSPRTEGVVKSSQKTCNEPQLDENTNKESEWDILNREASSDNSQITFGNSWMCPLTSEELSQLPSDAEREDPSEKRHTPESSGVTLSQDGSKSCSGVILKLRRMFSDGLNRKGMSYQPVLDSYTHAQTEPSGGELSPERSGTLLRRTPEVTNRWRRTSGGFSHALRPRSSCSKRKHRSLLKIKYCPYLSACHSAEHRRRWVLRSAVQRARRAMKIYYPDLVGKRIHHLYEEDDKSEVWYRGEVLRIHKAHPNPLKTIFEVRYDSEPGWKYYLELLMDYKKGWLKIQD